MSDELPEGESADHPITGSAEIRMESLSDSFTSASVITSSQTQGNQSWSIERAKLEQKAEADAHRRTLELENIKSEEAQKVHDRKKDWIIFCLVVCALAGGLIFGLALNFVAVDAETKRWGQNLIILIIGALGGYITGSKTS